MHLNEKENTLPGESLIGQPSKADTLNAGRSLNSSLPQVNQLGDDSTLSNRSLLAAGFTSAVDTNEMGSSRTLPEGMSQLNRVRDLSIYLVQPEAKVTVTPSFIYLDRQVWEGTVMERGRDSFVARVIDQTKPTNPAEQVTFSFEEVSPDDHQLVEEGASFYWRMGTERSPAGQVKNVSLINFRRLPQWSHTSIDRAERNARELASILFPKDDF